MGVGALFKLGGQVAKKVKDVPEEALKAAKVPSPEKVEEVRSLPAGAKRIGDVPKKGEAKQPKKLYRQGDREGVWWSEEREYADLYKDPDVKNRSGDPQEFVINEDEIKMFDWPANEAEGDKWLALPTDAEMDAALIERGYQGVIIEGEGGSKIYRFVDSPDKLSPTKDKPLPSGAKRIGDVPKKAAALAGAAVVAASASAAPSPVPDDVFYLNIGKYAESDHGDTPIDTHDAREEGLTVKSKDVGYGHKVKASEDKAGVIHGVKFKNEDGTYIPLTKENKATILKEDMAAELSLARKKGWDTKLKALGVKWDDLETPYKQALTSLAYNTGGSVAGDQFTAVLKAAKDLDVKEFAKQLRRNDNKKKTAGMDNRVAKELYYSGLIKSFSEVSDVLPLGSADGSGVPK